MRESSKVSSPFVTQNERFEWTSRLAFKEYAKSSRASGCLVKYSSCFCAIFSRAFGCWAEKMRRYGLRVSVLALDLGFCPTPKEAADSRMTCS
jgi:hypothetical protein